MSIAWIWTIWTVLMVGFSWFALVNDLGTYELAIFMAGALALSVAAVLYEKSTHTVGGHF